MSIRRTASCERVLLGWEGIHTSIIFPRPLLHPKLQQFVPDWPDHYPINRPNAYRNPFAPNSSTANPKTRSANSYSLVNVVRKNAGSSVFSTIGTPAS